MSFIVAGATHPTGLRTVRSHPLRGTAASETLNAHASLDEVAYLPRHGCMASTVY